MDGVSRFLSILALVVSLGGLFYLYEDNKLLKEQLAAVQTTADTGESAESFNERWNEQLTAALAEFKQQANSALQKADEARQARNQEVETLIAQLRTDRVDLANISQRVDALFVQAANPRLSLARTVMKPISAGEAGYVVIRNDSLADAEISSVVFRPAPGGQFKTASLVVPDEGDADQDRLVVEFDPRDNSTRTPGRHREYTRQYFAEELLIPRQQATELTVQIKNSTHQGWGWEGELELTYGDGETLTIPQIRAVFVPGETDEI